VSLARDLGRVVACRAEQHVVVVVKYLAAVRETEQWRALLSQPPCRAHWRLR